MIGLTRGSSDWQLRISAQKCFILHLRTQITSSYILSNSVINAPAYVKDLGVTIDKDLKFKRISITSLIVHTTVLVH